MSLCRKNLSKEKITNFIQTNMKSTNQRLQDFSLMSFAMHFVSPLGKYYFPENTNLKIKKKKQTPRVRDTLCANSMRKKNKILQLLSRVECSVYTYNDEASSRHRWTVRFCGQLSSRAACEELFLPSTYGLSAWYVP